MRRIGFNTQDSDLPTFPTVMEYARAARSIQRAYRSRRLRGSYAGKKLSRPATWSGFGRSLIKAPSLYTFKDTVVANINLAVPSISGSFTGDAGFILQSGQGIKYGMQLIFSCGNVQFSNGGSTPLVVRTQNYANVSPLFEDCRVCHVDIKASYTQNVANQSNEPFINPVFQWAFDGEPRAAAPTDNTILPGYASFRMANMGSAQNSHRDGCFMKQRYHPRLDAQSSATVTNVIQQPKGAWLDIDGGGFGLPYYGMLMYADTYGTKSGTSTTEGTLIGIVSFYVTITYQCKGYK